MKARDGRHRPPRRKGPGAAGNLLEMLILGAADLGRDIRDVAGGLLGRLRHDGDLDRSVLPLANGKWLRDQFRRAVICDFDDIIPGRDVSEHGRRPPAAGLELQHVADDGDLGRKRVIDRAAKA
jgi:hypothetical protein